MANQTKKTVGFFDEGPGVQSMARLLTFGCMLAAFGWTALVGYVYATTQAVDPMAMGTIGTLWGAAFGGKFINKSKEVSAKP